MAKNGLTIGVLAVQGDVLEHVLMMDEVLKMKNIDAKTILVKRPEQLDEIDGLIIPGGESTIMSRLITEMRFGDKLIQKIRARVKDGMGIFGTCAGTIMMAKTSSDQVVKEFKQALLELMDITVIRNRYGRQQESFEKDIIIAALGKQPFPGVFIRAPVITATKGDTEVLCGNSKEIYAVRQGKLLAVTFHPELTADTRIHEYFLQMLK